MNGPKVIDLFSGCGGMSLGFESAGYNVKIAVDNWKAAIQNYQLNFKHPIIEADLSDEPAIINYLKNFNADIIIGGPPCQDFSQAGKRDENGGRGNLTVSFAKIVAGLKPTAFVMENVDQLTKTDKFSQAHKIMKEAGYGITILLLDASLCGVPQKRKRYFVIGALGQEDDFLKKDLLRGLSKKCTTLRDYFGNSLGFEFYYRHPRTYARRGVFGLDEPSPTVRGVNRPIPKGYKPHKNDPTKDFSNVKVLSSKERALIQTFPSSFVFQGKKTEIEQLIGNAVPPKLAQYVGKTLLMFMKSEKKNKQSKMASFL